MGVQYQREGLFVALSARLVLSPKGFDSTYFGGPGRDWAPICLLRILSQAITGGNTFLRGLGFRVLGF